MGQRLRKTPSSKKPKSAPSPLHAGLHALAKGEAEIRNALKTGRSVPETLRDYRRLEVRRAAFARARQPFDPSRWTWGCVPIQPPCETLSAQKPVFQVFADEGVAQASQDDPTLKGGEGIAECPLDSGIEFSRVSFGFLSSAQVQDRRGFKIRSRVLLAGEMETLSAMLLPGMVVSGGSWKVIHQLIARIGGQVFEKHRTVEQDANETGSLDGDFGWDEESVLNVEVCLPAPVSGLIGFEEAIILEATKFGPDGMSRSFVRVYKALFDAVSIHACNDCE